MLCFSNRIKACDLPFSYLELPDSVGISIGSYLQSDSGSHPDHFVLDVPNNQIVLFCIFTAMSPDVSLNDINNWFFCVANRNKLQYNDAIAFDALIRQFSFLKWNEAMEAIGSELTDMVL